MAENLDDGEFWLPSHFLTDDDILMDFGFISTTHGGSSSYSAFTETESDDDDILTGQDSSSCPVHSKVLSSSPQSTLYGCVCNQSSSRESASPAAQPQGEEEDNKSTAAATFDLLNKAAGEVARLKLRIENNKKVAGTGFFDCSQKRVSYPPPLFFPPQFLHFPPPPPPMVWAQSNAVQQLKNRAIKNDNKSNTNKNKSDNNNNNNRPLGLPSSAWPPLQAQRSVQDKAQSQPTPSLFVGPPKGTGVFLPRCVATTTPADQPRKKDANTTTKSKSGKASQSQVNQRRNSGKPSATITTMTDHNDIQLPQDWTY